MADQPAVGIIGVLHLLHPPILLLKHLIPVLQNTVQVTSDDLARLSWMPLHSQDRRITRLNLVPHLARLPVPEHTITAAVT
jgi:hypothetical protein